MVGQIVCFVVRREVGHFFLFFWRSSGPEANIFRRDQLWRVSCLVMWTLVSLSRALVRSPSSRSVLVRLVSVAKHVWWAGSHQAPPSQFFLEIWQKSTTVSQFCQPIDGKLIRNQVFWSQHRGISVSPVICLKLSIWNKCLENFLVTDQHTMKFWNCKRKA